MNKNQITDLLKAAYAVDINPLPALRSRFGGKWEYLNPNGFRDEDDEKEYLLVFKPSEKHWVGYTE